MPAAVIGRLIPTPSKWVWTTTGSPRSSHAAPDRVVDRVAVRDPRAAGEEDADELVSLADAADLGRGRLGVLGGTTTIGPRSRCVALEPVLEQPVVVRRGELRREDDRWGGSRTRPPRRASRMPKATRRGRELRAAPGRASWPKSGAADSPGARRRPCGSSRSGGTRGSSACARPFVPEWVTSSRVGASRYGRRSSERVVADVDVAVDQHPWTIAHLGRGGSAAPKS